MGAETTFINRFNPPAIASMAYLPCCDEWADCRETEECPFCGIDLDKKECWGPEMKLVKAVFKFDRLETEGKYGQPPLPWTMDEALSALTYQAESKEPHIEVPEGLFKDKKELEDLIQRRGEQLEENCKCGHHRGRHTNYPAHDGMCTADGCKCGEFSRAWDGWPCEGWSEERRSVCPISFEDCNGKPDCPRNTSMRDPAADLKADVLSDIRDLENIGDEED